MLGLPQNEPSVLLVSLQKWRAPKKDTPILGKQTVSFGATLSWPVGSRDGACPFKGSNLRTAGFAGKHAETIVWG